MDNIQSQDFRLYLQQVFTTRSKNNPRYSLRAFAKSLGVNHAPLSQILHGKRPLTPKTQIRLASALGLGPEEVKKFRATSLSSNPYASLDFQEMSVDVFNLISEWYYDAILELAHLKSFKMNPKWIAKALGITINEVNIAVERLKRLGYPNTLVNTTHIGNFTNVAKKNYQKQALKMAADAIDQVPKSYRDHSSVMLAINIKDLPKVKEKIKKFRRNLSAFLQRKNAKPNEVYQLCVSFFPISHLIKKEEIKS